MVKARNSGSANRVNPCVSASAASSSATPKQNERPITKASAIPSIAVVTGTKWPNIRTMRTRRTPTDVLIRRRPTVETHTPLGWDHAPETSHFDDRSPCSRETHVTLLQSFDD